MNRTRSSLTFLLVMLPMVFSTSCGYLFGSGDCGYEARLKKTDGANNVEIRIHRVTAETVGSVTSCGYSYIHTRAKVDIGGTSLPELIGPNRMTETYVNRNDQGGVDYYYEAPASFDPQKEIIRIENKEGYTFTSRPETIKEWSAASMSVALKR